MTHYRNTLACLAIFAAAGCASLPEWVPVPGRRADEPARKEDVVAHPRLAAPVNPKAVSIWGEALEKKGMRVLVSTETRSLWLMQDSMTVLRAPIAVGRSKRLVYKGKEYDFTTPVGKRKVLAKATSPLWVPPDWHYFEIAVERGITPVHLKKGSRLKLNDSTRIEVRGNDVGRVNQYGNFWPFTPGMGNGYLLHGTNEEGTIGEAVSHGCVRMYNDDVERLYALVPVGTPVYIF
jgi:hypothetical protein